MTKIEFIELTNDIDNMIDDYERNVRWTRRAKEFGCSPYFSKMYSRVDKKRKRKEFSMLTDTDACVWIYHIREKLMLWTRCKYSYKNDFKFTYIWRFLQQDDDRMLLRKDKIAKKHPGIIKEFYEDLSRVYFVNFYKNNPKEFNEFMLNNYNGFVELKEFFKRNKIKIKWLDEKIIPDLTLVDLLLS